MNYLKVIGLALIISVACISGYAQSISQEVIGTSGTSWQNQNANLSWTLGESFIATLASDQNLITQGFHQHDSFLTFPLLGDANCDGVIDVLDVVTIISHILETDPEPFCIDLADLNQDGVLDILDAVGIINIILSVSKCIQQAITSSPALVYLSAEGIDLMSDGSLTALQFELFGDVPDQFRLISEDHHMMTSNQNKRLKFVIMSLQNQPFAKGRNRLINFAHKAANISWGEATGGNIYAERVEIIKHIALDTSPAHTGFRVYPNPSSGRVYIELSCQADVYASLNLTNLLGNTRAILFEGSLIRGTQHLIIEAGLLKPGFYLVQFQTHSHNKSAAEIHSAKLIITN